jgi:hypothetical protein
MDLSEGSNWCLSGGADGSDLMWGMTAGHAGHGVVHWSFNRHRSNAPAAEIVTLTPSQMAIADPHCARANKTMKRHWPPKSSYVRNLIRRNWYQVETAGSLYGISTFDLPTLDPQNGHVTRIAIGDSLEDGKVAGGTSWAVQMFIDKHNGEACPCYVFDQHACYWFEWRGRWVRIYEPPRPAGIWAGIGTRNLHQVGKLAIHVLMDYKVKYHEFLPNPPSLMI